ncbi:cyanophycinase [Pseudoalteromonas sp. SCSIO 43095]|uniref:cyanophycinase n=1 Tax=unclassified Pseudoalteromonas TaxID=194690 RepID=UPI0004463511|nr:MULTISPECIES: cyanophycinase [unclassified Pseudoalteromonas]EWS96936.1 cyanophycinase [Pseudoalteromonas sp. SCSIO_11900]URQ97682.1 cyanophycinase [Pseudoalteromonas sp. SCSIO 43095]
MERIYLPNKRLAKSRTVTAVFSFFIAFSLQLSAKESEQTLVLVGGALTTCASLSPKNCEKNTQIPGKIHNVFALSHAKISQIKLQWPSKNTQAKNKTIKNLATMQAKSSPTLSKKELLWLWRDIDSKQLNSLTDQEYNFVIDMLEVAQLQSDNTRLKEQVNTALNSESAATDILQFISGSLKVKSTNPSILAITASSRDPYESADFYEGLLRFPNINSQWLALTPALAKAITTNKCDDLNTLRHSEMGLYQREYIYPDRTQAEYLLCKNGTDALVQLIKNSTGVMFNGGDQSLTRKVLFDENNQPYPWTKALQSRPVVVGTSAGTAVQSGGQAHGGNVVMITNGTSLSALKEGAQAIDAPSERSNSDSLTYNRFGGLGTFSYGVLDTHFSERNRTLRLGTLLDSFSANQAQPAFGFGVDETTALVVIKSESGNLMTVIGKNGVVMVKSTGQAQAETKTYSYSYWPAGSVIDIKNNDFTLSQRSISQALPAIKIPPLPVQRFGSILTDAKLRSLTQAMCLSQEQTAVGQQDAFIISLSTKPESVYHRISAEQYGCAVSNLEISVSTF